MGLLEDREDEMSRSGYSDDMDDPWALIRWRGAVTSAIRGKYGQAFLKEMLAAMDALPEKKLIAHELQEYDDYGQPQFCALGTVGKVRNIDLSKLDPEDPETVADVFGIPDALAKEIVWTNDEGVGYWVKEIPEARFSRMRRWIESQIKETPK